MCYQLKYCQERKKSSCITNLFVLFHLSHLPLLNCILAVLLCGSCTHTSKYIYIYICNTMQGRRFGIQCPGLLSVYIAHLLYTSVNFYTLPGQYCTHSAENCATRIYCLYFSRHFLILYLCFLQYFLLSFHFSYYVYCYAPKHPGKFLPRVNLHDNKPDSELCQTTSLPEVRSPSVTAITQ